MKRIWIINHDGEPPTTGKNTRHYNLSKRLIEKEYDVKIFAASTMHTTDINYIKDKKNSLEKNIMGVPFVFIRTSNYQGNGISRIKNIIEYTIRVIFVASKHEKPDVIYASSPHLLAWLSGYILSKSYKSKFIVEVRDLWPETFVAMGKIKRSSMIANFLYKFEEFMYRKADSIVFTFPGGKDYLEEIGLDRTKGNYINNGIDIKEFNSNKIKHVYKDVDLDNKETFKILYTGSMGQANELSYLMRAAKEIKSKEYTDIKIILFGDGYQREELEEYAKENELDNVIFKGRVEKKYIPSILNRSDLNVFTGKNISLYRYGLSLNKLFEYFGSGKPTLSNIECGHDLLEEYTCGITVNGGSVESLVEGILRFYNMRREEYDLYCKNALKAAEAFDFEVLTDELEEVFLDT